MPPRLIVVAARHAHIVDWANARHIPKSMLRIVTSGDHLYGVPRGEPHLLLDDWNDSTLAPRSEGSNREAYIAWKLRELESPNVGGYIDWLLEWFWSHPNWKKR